MAVKAINDIAGYNGIMSTLLVFRAFLRMTHLNPLALLIIQQATIIKKAIAEIIRLHMQRQITDALQTYNRLSTDDVHLILLRLDALVQRIYKKSQNRPYKLLAIKGETATLKLPYRPDTFCMTNIKRYTIDDTTEQTQPEQA